MKFSYLLIFLSSNNIDEDTLVGTFRKIEVDYSGPDSVRFFLGGPGSENFEIDQQGNVTLKQGLDFEEKQSYELLVFTFLGEKSITNELVFNVGDVDEVPEVNLSILSSTLKEDIQTNTKLADTVVLDPEKNGIAFSLSGEDKDKVEVSDSGSIVLSQSLNYEEKKNLNFIWKFLMERTQSKLL